jgi:hypothetical protein
MSRCFAQPTAELKKGHAASASRAEVTAAEKKIADVTRQVSDVEAGKKQKKNQPAAGTPGLPGFRR